MSKLKLYDVQWDDNNSSAYISFLKKVELFWHRGSWCRPDEWVFMIDRSCASKCIMVEIGFFGVTLLRGGCCGNEQKEENLSPTRQDM